MKIRTQAKKQEHIKFFVVNLGHFRAEKAIATSGR